MLRVLRFNTYSISHSHFCSLISTLRILYILISPFLTRLPCTPCFLLIMGHTPELYHTFHTHNSTFTLNCHTMMLILHTAQLTSYIHVLHHRLHHALLVTCLYTDLMQALQGSILITPFAASVTVTLDCLLQQMR